MNKYFILLIVISLFSCEKKKPSATNQTTAKVVSVNETVSKDTIESIKAENTTEEVTTKQIEKGAEIVSILPKNIVFGDLKIEVSELDGRVQINSNSEFVQSFEIPLNGKTDAIIETDVDGNGFNEFYIVTNTGDLAAFSSYNNKSYGQINIAHKPFSFYANCTKVKFWEAKNKKLSITFENAAGALNTVRYKLKNGEASYQLVAE